jgi:stearoyl-CoA desaturase (delta-9 desaturase)
MPRPTTQLTVDAGASAPGGEPEVVAMEHEARARVLLVIVTAGPLVALGSAGWLAWGRGLQWHDLAVLAITYPLTGLGVTVGFHRLFTHRSFKTTRALRALFAVLGSMAIEGPVLLWVATHRKHHRFSDGPGDPHSPHLDRATGWRGTVRALGHAHLGWMFRGKDMANPRRYAKDLLADRDLRFISRTFPLWVAAGLAIPFGIGVALTGSLMAFDGMFSFDTARVAIAVNWGIAAVVYLFVGGVIARLNRPHAPLASMVNDQQEDR